MPKTGSGRKTAASAKHDPLAVQMRTAEEVDKGVLSQPGKRIKKRKRQQEEQVSILTR